MWRLFAAGSWKVVLAAAVAAVAAGAAVAAVAAVAATTTTKPTSRPTLARVGIRRWRRRLRPSPRQRRQFSLRARQFYPRCRPLSVAVVGCGSIGTRVVTTLTPRSRLTIAVGRHKTPIVSQNLATQKQKAIVVVYKRRTKN